MWTGLKCVRIRRVAGFCENGNEPSDSMKRAKLFDWATVSFSRRTAIHRLCFGFCCCCHRRRRFWWWWWWWYFQMVFYNVNSSVPTRPPYPASTGYSITGLKRPDAEADSSLPSSKAAVTNVWLTQLQLPCLHKLAALITWISWPFNFSHFSSMLARFFYEKRLSVFLSHYLNLAHCRL